MSPERTEVHVGFHDEPLLALAALNIFVESADLLVSRLSNELRHTALGPIGEIAAMLVCPSHHKRRPTDRSIESDLDCAFPILINKSLDNRVFAFVVVLQADAFVKFVDFATTLSQCVIIV